ncbi:DUF1048 domain-containing protein [Lacticaseibacillus baoqingensis]|uniref:DUF1048 domain-containing protein n=1 Tax=Lacticaseibacillus baoqingensis TaxID=2486013 RepID=A0ABW4E6K8_9LACO
MNWLERVTGRDMDRQMQTLANSVAALPADYQAAWQTIEKTLWAHADFTGRNLMPIMVGIVDLLQETASENLRVTAAIGPDPAAFAASVATTAGAQDLKGRFRQQLNREVARAAQTPIQAATIAPAGDAPIMADKPAWRAHMARVHALPAPYQAVYRAGQKYLFKVATPQAGPALAAFVDLLADGAAAGKPVGQVIGADAGQLLDDLLMDTNR